MSARPRFPEFAPRRRGLPSPSRRSLGLVGLAFLLVLVTSIGAMGLARALEAHHTSPVAGAQGLALSLDATQPNTTQPGDSFAVMPHTRVRPHAAETPPRSHTTQSAPPATQATTSNGCTVTATDTAAEQSLLALLNAHRAAAGSAPLKLSVTLSAISRAHTCDMMVHHYMGHVGSDGSTPLQRIQSSGLALSNWGENVGTSSGLGLMGGITEIDNGMMAEPLTPYDHHWNIVHAAFTQVGLGVLYVNGQVWLTEDFIG